MNRDEVAVMSAVRSPFGKFGGTLKDFTLPALGGPPASVSIRLNPLVVHAGLEYRF